ncbi:MAG: tetratricopeptide repeat protein [Psychrosphaera sp.]|nr:tetratricopeptide repeat protein [Psychrosphaera sp.]
MKELLELINTSSSSANLLFNGMGGVGKTAIWRALAHQCSHSSTVKNIVWLNCANGVLNALMAEAVTNHDIDIRHQDWLPQLLDKLRNMPAPSILFLDNLEESENDNDSLRQLKTLNWHIFATSRYPLAIFAQRRNIDVLEMARCIELFTSHYDDTIEYDEAATLKELITLAGQHTLTVELLAKLASDGVLSVTEVFEQVKKTGFDLSSLTEVLVDGDQSGTQQGSRQHQLHEHLEKLFVLANLDEREQTLLRLLAVLPHTAYDCKCELMPWLGLEKPNELVVLVKKGWLLRDGKSFLLHPVVGHVVRGQIGLDEGELVGFARKVRRAIKPDVTGHWIEKVGYKSQLCALVDVLDDSVGVKMWIIGDVARIYKAKGEYQRALPLYQQALEISEKTYGSAHIETSVTLNNLALLYDLSGEYDKALPLYQRSLDIVEKELGVEHIYAATRLNNLADLYVSMGEYDKALPMYQRTLEIEEKEYGIAHPAIAITLNNWALLYYSMGECDKALPLYQRSLDICEEMLGAEHPDTAISLNNLALLYKSMGEYRKAEPMHLRSLQIREKSLGPKHPDVALVLINLAALYRKTGRDSEAEPLEKRAEAIRAIER